MTTKYSEDRNISSKTASKKNLDENLAAEQIVPHANS